MTAAVPAVPAPAVTGLLQAIAGHLTLPPGDALDPVALTEASAGVRLAITAILARGPDPATLGVFTALLAGHRVPLSYELPGGHGENHINDRGQVVWGPGECVGCHGQGTPGGAWIPAGAAG